MSPSSQRVPFFSSAQRDLLFREDLFSAFQEVIGRGQFIGGSTVEHFEQLWAMQCGAKHCVGTGNGLDSLRLALQALGIGPGHEVIVPAFTFPATWLAVIQLGAKPVPVDVHLESGNIDVSLLEGALSSRTRGVVAVDLFGRVCHMPLLRSICDREGLVLVEDAAQAHGAMTTGCRVGSLADATAYSFYPTKNLGALGDAGAVTTNDDDVARRIRLLGSYGYGSTPYDYQTLGWNSRLDPLQAAALTVFLPHLAAWNDERRRLAKTYRDALAILPGVDCLNQDIPLTDAVWHHFVLRLRDREGVKKALLHRGVETRIHYPQAVHQIDPFARYLESAGYRVQLPRAEALAASVLSLPMHPWLGDEVFVVTDALSQLDELSEPT